MTHLGSEDRAFTPLEDGRSSSVDRIAAVFRRLP